MLGILGNRAIDVMNCIRAEVETAENFCSLEGQAISHYVKGNCSEFHRRQ